MITKRKFNSSNYLLYGLILVILLTSAVTYLNWPECTSIQEMSTMVKVKEAVNGNAWIGLTGDTDKLDFGGVSPGSISSRKIKIKRIVDADVSVSYTNEIGKWMSVKPSPMFSIKSGEEKEITVEINVPQEVQNGKYEGTVKFCFKE